MRKSARKRETCRNLPIAILWVILEISLPRTVELCHTLTHRHGHGHRHRHRNVPYFIDVVRSYSGYIVCMCSSVLVRPAESDQLPSSYKWSNDSLATTKFLHTRKFLDYRIHSTLTLPLCVKCDQVIWAGDFVNICTVLHMSFIVFWWVHFECHIVSIRLFFSFHFCCGWSLRCFRLWENLKTNSTTCYIIP